MVEPLHAVPGLVAMSEYAYLFSPFWKCFDAALTLIGVWFALQPSVLVEPFAAMVFTRERGAKLGLPNAISARLLEISQRREDLHYQTNLLRLIGAAFVAAGLAGLLTSVDQPTLVSGLIVVSIATLAGVVLNARRKAPAGAALLDRSSRRIVPWWFVGVLVVEAAAEASVGTRTSLAVAVATVVCAALISLLASLPVVLSGNDVALERQIDRRFRVAQVMLCAVLSQLPSLAWAASIDNAAPSTVVARVIVSVTFLSVILLVLTTSRRLDHDLRQAAGDALF
jgi:hypothetical protein